MPVSTMSKPQTAWKPGDIDAFISDYRNGADDFTLAKNHESNPDKVKKFLRFLRETEGLPSRSDLESVKDFEYSGAAERTAFVQFLSKSRTRTEIIRKFGVEMAEQLLEGSYIGYNLFKQIDDYGIQCFVLLPQQQDKIVIKPRAFTYHESLASDNTGKQGYILINFPDSAFSDHETGDDSEIKIVPLYDVHYGHHTHRHEEFLQVLRYIEETPNVYTFGGGDLLENALDDGRGMTYDNDKNPTTQLQDMISLLAPIAHKMLFMIPGNHEQRTYQKAGIDPTKVIADKLKIPYFDCPVYASLHGAGKKWSIYAKHGSGHAQTKGGKMNMAASAKKFLGFVNFIVSGHVHDPLVNPEIVIVEDPIGNCIVYKKQWVVVCPAFLGYANSYAQRAGYGPPGSGAVALHLLENGKYRASFEAE